MRSDHVSWDVMLATGCKLPIVVGGVISGYLCPDRVTQGMVVGWGEDSRDTGDIAY